MTANLGAVELPVPTGAEATPFDDPFITGLLALLGHAIKAEVDARLVQIRTSITDACAIENRFDFDPRSSFVRFPMPALYVWWSGRSKNIEHSTIRNRRERELSLLYVVAPVLYPDGATAFAGVLGAVDAAICQASDRGYHPTFGYDGDAVGTPLVTSLAAVGSLAWEYTGGQVGVLEPVPRKRRNADPNAVEECYPALQGSIKVSELRTDSTADEVAIGAGALAITDEEGLAYFDRTLSP